MNTTNSTTRVCSNAAALLAALLTLPRLDAQDAAAPAPLRVSVTTANLGSLVRAVGGALVDVTVFARPGEDPHFVVAKPSFVKTLHGAELYAQVGLDLEIGWAPVLLQQARNADVLKGKPGYLDASTAIRPLDVPRTTVDRSQGDVHPYGNPHYLVDPIRALAVARGIRDRLSSMRPDSAAEFEANYQTLRAKIGAALVGAELAATYDFEKLLLLHERDKLMPFLESQDDTDKLGGYVARFARYRGTEVVADHNAWPYLLDRLGLRSFGFLEPYPGIPPTTSHLRQLVERMRAAGVHVLLTVPYYDPRYTEFMVENADAHVARLAHQAGALPGTDDYIGMMDHNMRAILTALEARGGAPVR